MIVFAAAEIEGPAVTAPVRQGKYEARVAAGKKIVQISAPLVVGEREGYELTEEQLPPHYNSQSELTFEVKPGANTKDWSVESLKK